MSQFMFYPFFAITAQLTLTIGVIILIILGIRALIILTKLMKLAISYLARELDR